MSGVTQPYSQFNFIPTFRIEANPVVIGTTVHNIHTVPAGKKAILSSLFTRLVSLGGNVLIRFQIVGAVTSRIVETTVPETILTEKLSNTTGIELDAGDILQLVGDSGSDNGSVGYIAKLQETPV